MKFNKRGIDENTTKIFTFQGESTRMFNILFPRHKYLLRMNDHLILACKWDQKI